MQSFSLQSTVVQFTAQPLYLIEKCHSLYETSDVPRLALLIPTCARRTDDKVCDTAPIVAIALHAAKCRGHTDEGVRTGFVETNSTCAPRHQ